MARSARVVVPDMPHHVTQRGNYQQVVFDDDEDRAAYLRILRQSASLFGVRIWAWCLMNNHVHLVAVPADRTALALTFGRTHAAFALHVHQHRGLMGHLWQARFHSCVLDDDHLRAAMRYVELNPVRAGLVRNAEDYPWSSARAHLLGQTSSLLDSGCPVDDPPEEWREFLAEGVAPEMLTALRTATRTGRPAATPFELELLEMRTGRILRHMRRGPKPGKAQAA